jgi:hypothetical protein
MEKPLFSFPASTEDRWAKRPPHPDRNHLMTLQVFVRGNRVFLPPPPHILVRRSQKAHR